MELEVWDAFCDHLKEAGRAVVRPECPSSAEDRAEGFRYLLGFLQSTLTGFLQNAGPDHPAFVRTMDDVVKFGLDAPDGVNSYSASIRDDLTYRIWGNAGTVHYLGWQLMAPGQGTVANISMHDFEVAADGSFEIVLSREPHGGNWVEMPPGATRIMMRQFQYDWEHERYADVHIEAVDASPGIPACLRQRPDPQQFGEAVHVLGEQFALQANFWVDFIHGFRAGGDNIAPPAILNPSIGGSVLQKASNGYWVLGPGDALLIEFEPPLGHYWSVCLGNFWFETIELSHHQTSLNGYQAHVDDDGVCRIVISHRDPGVANWLDTVRHDQGTMTFRWLLCDTAPDIRTRVVDAREIDDRLPPSTRRVSGAERAQVISMRRAAVSRRFGLPLTTRWTAPAPSTAESDS